MSITEESKGLRVGDVVTCDLTRWNMGVLTGAIDRIEDVGPSSAHPERTVRVAVTSWRRPGGSVLDGAVVTAAAPSWWIAPSECQVVRPASDPVADELAAADGLALAYRAALRTLVEACNGIPAVQDRIRDRLREAEAVLAIDYCRCGGECDVTDACACPCHTGDYR